MPRKKLKVRIQVSVALQSWPGPWPTSFPLFQIRSGKDLGKGQGQSQGRTERLLSLLCLAILNSSICHAENWGLNGKNELPPESNENRIIKWCDDKTGEKIRFSSANIQLKDYHPCGAIVPTVTCDGEGNKVLGNPKTGIFTDCQERQQKSKSAPEAGVTPLSHLELKELKSVMKKAAKKQNSDPEIQLQMLADQLMAMFMGNSKDKDLSKLLNSKDSKKMMENLMSKLEKSLPLIDSSSRKLIEPLLKNFKKSK